MKDLKGVWRAENCDRMFFDRDTIVLHKDRNFHKENCCHYIIWTISDDRQFYIEEMHPCDYPAKTFGRISSEKVKIHNKKYIDILKFDELLKERYKIVSVDIQENNGLSDIIILTLVRIELSSNLNGSIKNN